MNISKAIRRLGSFLKYRKPDPNNDFYEAVQLGREALKWRLQIEREDPEITLEPLPGETED